MSRLGRPWHGGDAALLGVAVALTLWLHRQPLLDMLAIGLRDEEQSHIFLAPLVAAWLLWLRRSRLRDIRMNGSFAGVGIAAAGWMLSWWGFARGVQAAWHAGAMLSLGGVLVSFTGVTAVRRLAPVFAVLVFMIPIPGVIRHQVAYPMQQLATSVTFGMLELLGVGAVRSGNVLIINGEPVAVGEACNGLRLVFALALVVYAFAFGTPLRPMARVVLLGLSPVVAILCNVVRLVPTSLVFGYGDAEMARNFHDLAGWAMLGVALLILAGVLRAFRWLELPVVPYRLLNQ